MRVLAVGDLHRKIEYAERAIRYGYDNKYDKIVFVGDFADNFFGDYKDTFRLWDLMMCPPKGCKRRVVPLMGNHDYAYAHAPELKMLFGFNDVQTGFDSTTLLHLDIPRMYDMCKRFKMYVEIDGVYYSHAGFTQSWVEFASDCQLPKTCAHERMWFVPKDGPLWARYTPAEAGYFYAKAMPRQVFGHTPSKTCHEEEDGCWCIDTFSTDRLGRPIGDCSILEIVDGRDFRVIPMDTWFTSIKY